MSIKFSVIMPNLNGEKYLEKSITAFLNQDYENKELIIVDSSSTDNSHKIIEKYADNNIVKWVKEKDTSLSDAINIGMKYVTGDYIGYLGSDDISLKGAYAKANELLSIVDNVDALFFNSYSYAPNENHQKYYNIQIDFNKINLLRTSNFVGLQNIFFKKSIYEKYKFDPSYKYAMDYEIYLRILTDYEKIENIEGKRKGFHALHIPMAQSVNIIDNCLSQTGKAEGREECYRAAIKYAINDEQKNIVKRTFGKAAIENIVEPKGFFAYKKTSNRLFINLFGIRFKFKLAQQTRGGDK